MVDSCGEDNSWGFERVVLGKLDGEAENASLEWSAGRACTSSCRRHPLILYPWWSLARGTSRRKLAPPRTLEVRKREQEENNNNRKQDQTCEAGSRSKSVNSAIIRLTVIFFIFHALPAANSAPVASPVPFVLTGLWLNENTCCVCIVPHLSSLIARQTVLLHPNLAWARRLVDSCCQQYCCSRGVTIAVVHPAHTLSYRIVRYTATICPGGKPSKAIFLRWSSPCASWWPWSVVFTPCLQLTMAWALSHPWVGAAGICMEPMLIKSSSKALWMWVLFFVTSSKFLLW